MSERHVAAVFGPRWVRESRAQERYEAELARRIIIILRTLLREHDPSLPDPYDGTSWMEIEAVDPLPMPLETDTAP